MTPFNSEDLTALVEQDGNEFVVIRSPESASTIPTTETSAVFRHARKPWNSCHGRMSSFVIPEAAQWLSGIAYSRSWMDSGFAAFAAPRNDDDG